MTNELYRVEGVRWLGNSSLMLVWSENSIHLFGSERGNFIGTFAAHDRRSGDDEIRITSVALSPNQRWLCSGDSRGTIITTQLNFNPMPVDELRTYVRGLTGRMVDETDSLVEISR